MAFNETAFERAQWRPRTQTLKAPPELVEFFAKGEPAEFRVRGLLGNEAARMRQEGDVVERMSELASQFTSGNAEDMAAAIAKRIGADPKATPDEVFKHVFAVETGLEYPKLQRTTVMALHNFHHGFFQQLVRAVLELSTSAEPGKPKGSGKTSASEPT